MVRYETLLLTVPEITADEARSIEDHVERLVGNNKGTLLSFEKWGKYRLSYPVKKNEYGVYYLARFEAEQPHPLLDEVKNALAVTLGDLIMRSMISRLDMDKSLAYNRPQSLEETPDKEVGSFLKEGKVEALLSSDDRRRSRRPYDKRRDSRDDQHYRSEMNTESDSDDNYDAQTDEEA